MINAIMRIKRYLQANFIAIVFSLSTAALLVAICVYAGLGWYSRYLADDFCTAGFVKTIGFWNSQAYWYLNWTGRYAFTFIVSLFEEIGPGIVPWLPGAALLIWFVSAFALICGLIEQVYARKSLIFPAFLAALVLFVLLATLPNVGQDIYWQTGLATYLLPVILGFTLGTLLIALTPRYTRFTSAGKTGTILAIFWIAWINSGFSEIATILQMGIIGLVIVIQIAVRLREHRFAIPVAPWVAAAAGTALGMLVLIIAPGNAIRQLSYVPHSSLISVFATSIYLSSKYILQWFIKNSGILWPVLTVAFLAGFCAKPASFVWRETAPKKLFGMALLFLFAVWGLVLACFLASTWALSNEPPERVLILPATVLSLASILFLFVAGSLVQPAFQVQRSPLWIEQAAIALVFIYFIGAAPLYHSARIYSQKGEAVVFAEKWDQRNQAIQDKIQTGQSQLTVALIGSNLMGLEHIQTDPGYWINVCAARYYGVEQISAQ